ncbi:MAG: LysR substrate-binding domain-containing protein [Algiphilus sp.]
MQRMKVERLPLNALRAFSEAARTGSFKTAAQRLGVTPGAVSRQVKHLEHRLGIALFERQANGVRLREAGRLLAKDVDAGLARIAEGIQQIPERPRPATTLRLSVSPSFSQLWLLPRLADFQAREERVEITLDADQGLTEPAWRGGGASLALRYGRAPWPGVRSLELFGEQLFPVCAPALLERAPIAVPADLLDHDLLEVDWRLPGGGEVPGWRHWFTAAGLPMARPTVRSHYSLYSLALDQAIAGRGIVLASEALVADRLASGVLTRPFGSEYRLPSPFTYALVLPATGEAPPAARRFIDWLQAEAADFRRRTDAVGG